MRNLLPLLYHKIIKGATKWQSKKTEDTVQKYFFKSQQKPIDNYSGIVYNKDTIKQGAKAPEGVKNEKHGKRKR